jgi:hypothetical protein
VGSSTSHTPAGLHGLLQGQLYFTYVNGTAWVLYGCETCVKGPRTEHENMRPCWLRRKCARKRGEGSDRRVNLHVIRDKCAVRRAPYSTGVYEYILDTNLIHLAAVADYLFNDGVSLSAMQQRSIRIEPPQDRHDLILDRAWSTGVGSWRLPCLNRFSAVSTKHDELFAG